MSHSTWNVNKTFDAFDQAFTILAPDGVTPVLVELSTLRKFQLLAITGGISEGTQVGAALLLLLCLLLVTKADKRRSLVFLLNSLALLLVVLRGVFACLTYTGAFYDWYRWELYYYQDAGNAQAISICTEVLNFLLVAVLEVSLVLQARIVCCTLEPQWRLVVNIFNTFVALLEIGARFALTILDITWNILGVDHESEWQFHRLGRLDSATNILLVISIGTSAAIFCAKLGFAIQSRRSMGIKQFGPMQIIFVMGCQTMCTPLIFILIVYYGIKNADMQTFVPTVVALSLPLSAMWAAANTTHFHIADPDPQRRLLPVGHAHLASGNANAPKSTSTVTATATTMSDTLIDDTKIISLLSPSARAEYDNSKPDLEMQTLGDGVHVDRTYSVRSD